MPLLPAARPRDDEPLRMEERRLNRAFGRALTVTLALPLTVIACSHTRTSPKADAGVDACVPTLAKVFFGEIDGAPECRATQRLNCGLPSSVELLDGGCIVKASDCKAVCPSYGALSCQLADASCPGGHVLRDGPLSVSCDFCPGGIGRRPSELVAPAARESSSALVAYFERAAFLEGASVRAFGELCRALAAMNAPSALLDEARQATRDERAHLRATTRLARRFGGRAPPSARSSRQRSAPCLEDLARENAAEGCVRETYGALVAHHQARHASDAHVRRAMASIAVDETRHAALSWAILRWATERMKSRSRGVTASALRAAISELHREVGEPHRDVLHFAGIPTAIEQRRLLSSLEEYVWS